jgi:hypothetical protein
LTEVEELRRCALVLLVVDVPKPRLVNSDGSSSVFAYDEDPILAALEWCTMSGIRVTQDHDEPHDAVLLVMTEGWRKSSHVTRAVVRAQRMRLPLFFVDPRAWKIVSRR